MSSTESQSPGAVPRTLDDYLAGALPMLNKRERRRLAARGGITVNGREVTDVAEPVGEGDSVELPPPPGGSKWKPGDAAAPPAPAPPPPPAPAPAPEAKPAPPAAVRTERPPRTAPREREWATPSAAPSPRAARERYIIRGLRLVYEDDDLIVVDKGPGLVTADPTHRNTDTVFDALKVYARRSGGGGGRGGSRSQRMWVIHRLDKESSGLLVFAKTSAAFEALKEEFRSKRTDRVYYAVVEGVAGAPGFAGTHQSFLLDGTGDAPQVKSIAASEFRGTPGKDAKLAVTHYRVVASDPTVLAGTGGSLLQVRLDTGRKNQIRAHMADLGHPIVGDRRYGGISDALGRVALHASELGFTHPRTGRPLRFSSPPPAAFYRCVGTKPPREQAEESAGVQQPVAPRPSTDARGEIDTSWDRVAGWYDDLLSEKRNDHYEEVILPGTLRLIGAAAGMRVLDVACGQGILCRRLAELGTLATGVDSAPQLIAAARTRGSGSKERGVQTPEYHAGDARELGKLGLRDFDAAACVMALANMEPLDPVLRGIALALKPGGSLTFVVAHPAFRAPGQTSWGWDDRAGRQYRRVDGYLSLGQKAIQMHPGKDTSIVTWTFHRPLQAYAKALADAGFVIERIEEWPGKRTSEAGPRAAEENRIRREIPLFLAVRAVKQA